MLFSSEFLQANDSWKGKGKNLLFMMISWCYKSSSSQLPVESFFSVLVFFFFFLVLDFDQKKNLKEKKSLTIIQKTASLDFLSKCMKEATAILYLSGAFA